MKITKLLVISVIIFSIIAVNGCSDNSLQPEDVSSTELMKNNSTSDNGIVMDNLTNTDMEDSTKGYWHGGYQANAYNFEYSDEEFVSGSHSLKLSVVSSGNGGFAYWAQTFSAAELTSQKATLKVSAKYNDVVGDGVMFVFRGDDTEVPQGAAEAFNTTQSKIKIDGTSDWRALEISLDPVPDNIKSLTVYMLISAQAGTVYFDDLSLTSSEASGPVLNLVNGDFESGTLVPDNWWTGGTYHNSISSEWSATNSSSPSHSAKLSSNVPSGNFAFWAQTFSAENYIGSMINLGVKIKAENLEGKGVYIAVRGDSEAQPGGSAELFATTQGKIDINGTFDWTSYQVSTDKVGKDIKWITVYLIYGDSTSGDVYFDDVAITK